MATCVGLITHSPEATRELGAAIGRRLDCPAVITLTGDLGSGKTCLVQGLARGLDVPPEYYITSPSYTLINEYPGRCTLFHVDLYRLEGVADTADIGLDDAIYGDGITAIEWPDRLPEGAVPSRTDIRISEAPGEDTRRWIEVRASGQEAMMAYLQGVSEEKEGSGAPPAAG